MSTLVLTLKDPIILQVTKRNRIIFEQKNSMDGLGRVPGPGIVDIHIVIHSFSAF